MLGVETALVLHDRLVLPLAAGVLMALGTVPALSGGLRAAANLPAPTPTVGEYQFLAAGVTPPTEANCFSVGRRCFTPTSMQASDDVGPLYAAGHSGRA